MSIRSRLRSFSYSSSDKTSTIRDDPESTSRSQQISDNVGLGECDLCGQQNDSEGRRWLLTCSVCATQYHLKCLDLRSDVFQDPDSRAFRTWACKNCRRCLYCRKKKTKVSNDLISSLRSHPERKLNSLEVISCQECDSSIHTICFFKLQKDHDKDLPPLSVRELRKRRKNFVCNQCSGDSHHESDDLDDEEEDEEEYDEEEEEVDEEYDSNEDLESADEENDHRQQVLRNQLRKLGIIDLEQHMNSINDDQQNNVRTTRSRRNTTPQASQLPPNQPLTITPQPIKEKHHSKKNNENNNQIQRHDDSTGDITKILHKPGSKRKRKKSESLALIESPKKQKCSNLIASSPASPLSMNNDDLDHYNSENIAETHANPMCPVSGCDSMGHLSGAFERHSIAETCPLFHNQTVEQCIERYKRRMERKVGDLKFSPRRSSPRKAIVVQKNPKWDTIMDQRNKELKSLNIESNINVTSSRQPMLDNFVPKFDLELYLESQSQTAQMIHENSSLESKIDESNGIVNEVINKMNENQTDKRKNGVQSIIFGKREISVWYNSPYSDEFQNCIKLFICEYCLKCMNSSIILQRHLNKCSLKHPPGNEIYRKGKISFFEIDGNKQKEYCQNLCLLAKLFLDYKTLFFDVEPFLFYVMTENNQTGMHVIGYFSKEKYSPNSYNVSCILTLPQYQRTGYGRMLIEFSYLLTRMENKVGSPEKPLSDLGIISYRSYWKFIIMEYLSTNDGKDILLKDISQQTGVNATDIVSTLQLMGLLKYWKGKHLILINDELRKRFAQEVKRKLKLFGDKVIDPKYLKWTPTIYPEKSIK